MTAKNVMTVKAINHRGPRMRTDHDLRQALIDVRKAYRLIWLYQRRVVDITRIITDSFGYKFYIWDTQGLGGRMPGVKNH